MEKGKKENILFGVFMVIMLIAPFIIFGQMADRKQAESTRHNTTVSSEEPKNTVSTSEGPKTTPENPTGPNGGSNGGGRKKLLPSTGEVVATGLVLTGVLVLAGAVVLKRKMTDK